MGGKPVSKKNRNVSLSQKIEVPLADEKPVVNKRHQLYLQRVDFFDGDSCGQGIGFDAVLLFTVALLGQ